MKWPVWREVLGPTLLVGVLWLLVSTSTTVFMSWKDAAYQELLSNNLKVVESIQSLQSALTAAVLSRGREQSAGAAQDAVSRLADDYDLACKALNSVANPETARQLQNLQEDYGFLVSREAPA
ncbi:MAG: hypothetical protein ACKOJF_31825, partial [Planctomycetaceae bacterium]